MFLSPQNVKQIHFVGIGGIGMSGIAEILNHLGYIVTGSDLNHNDNIERLINLGIPVALGHCAENIFGSQVVVISSAITDDNPEVAEARHCQIPVLKRCEMLAELMKDKNCISISGTHGKTTTTSLVAQLLEQAKLNPTVVNGGIISSKNTNAYVGDGQWMVVEADESDGSLLKLSGAINVVTNIDPEHMDYYHTFDNLKQTFINYISSIPFYGVSLLCIDHPTVAEIAQQIEDRRIVTYGIHEDAQIQASNIRFTAEGTYFDINIKPDRNYLIRILRGNNSSPLPSNMKDVFLPMFGPHNVKNALVTVGIAHELGLSEQVLRDALSNFQGVKRRFTTVGTGAGMRIIDDYAHHPVEIENVIKAAQQIKTGKIIIVMQPHRYSRLNNLMDDFSKSFEGSDAVIVTPVYAAGESPIANVNHMILAKNIAQETACDTYTVENVIQLTHKLLEIGSPNDLVICMGAGNISQWAAQLPEALEKLSTGHKNNNINLSMMTA